MGAMMADGSSSEEPLFYLLSLKKRIENKTAFPPKADQTIRTSFASGSKGAPGFMFLSLMEKHRYLWDSRREKFCQMNIYSILRKITYFIYVIFINILFAYHYNDINTW